MLVLLFVCYGLALAVSYRLASRLAPTSLLHTAALTLTLWIVNLIVPLTYLGLVNALRLEWMVIGGVVFWGAQGGLAARLRPLPALAFVDNPLSVLQVRYLRYAKIFFAACFVTIVLVIVTNAIRSGPIEDTDAAWQYVPAAVNMMQTQTLFSYDHILPYLPLAFETLFVWELAFVQGLRFIPFFHLAIWIASLMYSALLVQLLLRNHTRFTRLIATYAVLLLLVVSRLSLTLVVSTGKNDILLLLCTLAAVYYLLRYWENPTSLAPLVLVGLIGGVQLGAKLTGAIWLGLLTLYHVYMLMRQHLIKPHTLLRDLLAVGIPFVLVFLPWGVRLLISPASAFDPDAIGSNLTILRQFSSPEFVSATLARLPEVILVLMGSLLVTAFRNQPRRIFFRTGLAVLAVGLIMQTTDSVSSISLSLFITLVFVSAIFIFGLSRQTHNTLVLLFLMLLTSMVLLAFVPYSATIYRFPEPINYTFQTIMYRFSPGSYYVFVVAIAASITALVARKQPAEAPRVFTTAQRTHWRYAIIPVALALMLVYGHVIDMDRLADRYLNFRQRFAAPTAFYDWFDDSIRASTIYAINVPSLLLYGRDFSNRVYHPLGQYSGYFGDMAYRWSEIQQLIETYQWTHIVVSFSYPEMQQAGLMPTPEVLAEIALMRRNLEVVYEDEQIILFATR
ncbi:MAG: hypothetical protein SF123_16950 [Chloroflexota bacterium]|nr:hypothetical protein [Chloroflexota bacterium]